VARSVWKGPFVEGSLIKKVEKASSNVRSEVIKTWSRRSTILPQFVGLTFGVYNGKKFIPPRKWSVTSSASSRRRGPLRPTRATRRFRRINR